MVFKDEYFAVQMPCCKHSELAIYETGSNPGIRFSRVMFSRPTLWHTPVEAWELRYHIDHLALAPGYTLLKESK